jgi:arylsulfatase A-like enzyme
VDLAPTIAELSDVEMPEADGRSAVPLLRGEQTNWRERFLIEFYFGLEWTGWRSETEKYVVNDTGEKELYDLVADPYELRNRYAESERSGETAGAREAGRPLGLFRRGLPVGGRPLVSDGSFPKRRRRHHQGLTGSS